MVVQTILIKNLPSNAGDIEKPGSKMTARATLTCRQNSHPFQDRTLILDQPAKVGRSVARVRPAVNNAIFDCKVLSRNHAVLWYDNGKFYLQDTKSSNGTFINNQRLSKGSEESAPREVCSGDIVQFGVDVMENSRTAKVTHGCIVATLKLYLPDGKEAKASPSTLVMSPLTGACGIPTQELYQLAQYLQEALHREQQLEGKLATLQKLVANSTDASESGWKALIDEDRLLTRLEILESQLQTYSKSFGDDKLRDEVSRLQDDKNNYQISAKESLMKVLQEKLETLRKLQDVEHNLGNAEYECGHMREVYDKTQGEIREIAEKYNKQLQEIQQLNEKLQETQEKHAEVVKDLETEKNMLLGDCEDLRKQEEALQAKVVIDVDIESLHADNKFIEQQLMEIKIEAMRREKDEDTKTVPTTEFRNTDSPVNTLLEKIEDEMENNLRGALRHSEDEVTKLKNQLQFSEKELLENKDKMNDLEKQLEQTLLNAVQSMNQINQCEVQLKESRSVDENSVAITKHLQDEILRLECELKQAQSNVNDTALIICKNQENGSNTGLINHIGEPEANLNNSLKAEIEKLKELLAETREKKKTAESDTARIKVELEDACNSAKKYMEEMLVIRQQLQNAQQQSKDKSDIVVRLQDQLVKAEGATKQQVVALKEKLAEEQQRNKEIIDEANNLKQQLSDAQQSNKQTQNEAKQMRDKMNSLVEDIERRTKMESQSGDNKTSDEYLTLKEDCSSLRNRLHLTEAEMRKAHNEYEKLEVTYKQLADYCSSLEKSMDGDKSGDEPDDLAGQVTELRNQLLKLQLQYNECNDERARLHEALSVRNEDYSLLSYQTRMIWRNIYILLGVISTFLMLTYSVCSLQHPVNPEMKYINKKDINTVYNQKTPLINKVLFIRQISYLLEEILIGVGCSFNPNKESKNGLVLFDFVSRLLLPRNWNVVKVYKEVKTESHIELKMYNNDPDAVYRGGDYGPYYEQTYGSGGTAEPEPDEEEGEMVATERELAEDAQWKRIQQNTFTRWANEHLKTVNKHIGNLETDLSDGLRLIGLVEVLSGKRLPKHNKRPTFRSQKLENVSVALKFLEEDEGIRIVNIDSSDIADCKLKLILGLIWTLILHYSISAPVWEGEDEFQYGDKVGPTPKQRLLGWIQSKIPDLPITNFTKDWNDGKAVGALVDAVAPGLCPDWLEWDPNNARANTQEAMDLADNWLGIPQLIKPEEMIDPKVDEMSMMTYLSQYPNNKLKPGAPLRPRTNPNRVRAYGPGIEPTGVVVGAPANFIVETFSAGKGAVEVYVENPRGQNELVDTKFNNDRNLTYSITYKPQMEGPHKVTVRFANKEIPKSPYLVTVEGHAGDPSKVTASGPGLEPSGVMMSRPTYFDVQTKDAGLGAVEVIILDPQGHKNTVPTKVRQLTPDMWRCEYVAPQMGLHSVNIFFAGQAIPNSPFGVRVTPVCDPKKVRVAGRGIQPSGVRVRDVADFRVFTEGAGEGNLEVKVVGPGGLPERVEMYKSDSTTYEYKYNPTKEGRYLVIISFGGQEILKSPYEVTVGPFKESRIRAYGPGLLGGVVGYPAVFTVETNGETGALGFSIEGPSQTKIDCHDNGDGTADVSYHPTAPGEYAVHILCNNEDIPQSPFMAQILPKTDYFPDKVEAYGPGLEKSGISLAKPADFTVDTRRAGGHAPLDLQVMDAEYHPVDLKVQDLKDGTFKCSYTPMRPMKHTVQAAFGGVAIKNSPFRVFVTEPTNPSKVKVFGPGVEKGIKSETPTHFNIDCREAGPGDVEISLINDKGQDIPVQIQDNEDSTFTVDYTAPTPGNYKVNVRFAGKDIPQSPIKVSVQPHIDINKVKVDGLEPTAPVHSLQQFRVITKGAGKGDVAVTITTPSGRKMKAHIVPTYDGYMVTFTPTELGEYLLAIAFGGEPISPTPFRFISIGPSELGKVRAFGPGLSSGIVFRPAEFTIDTREAGQGGLGVTVEGPCEAAINCRDNGDGTCSVAYLPTEGGTYVVNITFNEKHIPGSPFQALVSSAVDVSKVKVTGNGIQFHGRNGVFLDSTTDMLVDARAISKRGDGRVACTITNPSGAKTDTLVQSMNDGTYRISYTPFEEGRHIIDITYDGLPVPGSPFSVNVRRGCDPKKCRAFGPGLDRGITDQPNQFTVETRGSGTGGLGLAIEGPSEAKMTCKDNRDGSCTVEYIPTEAGDYDITIKFADQHIPGSPFKVSVDSLVDPSKVLVFGPGVDPVHCRSNVPVNFKVDASKSGKAPLGVEIKTERGPIARKPDVRDNGDGTYDVSYVAPPEGSRCNVKVAWNNQDVPGSPFQMKVRPTVEPRNVKVHGPGVTNKGVPASVPVDFIIDTKEAGFGDLEVFVTGPDAFPRKVKVQDNADGTFKATYVPDDIGKYKINVKYGGQEVPFSPFNVDAHSIGQADKCKITEGMQQQVAVGEEYCITVNAKNAGKGAVTCRIRSNSGHDMDIDIEDNGDGTFSIYYTIKDVGEYNINVKFGGQPVPDGAYKLVVSEHLSWFTSSRIQPHLLSGIKK
uniref:Sarcolemmal membrane-associated protein n=1 Tax=Strigamia maritima TaxID=126957 RepID=T1IWF9_STRMM